MIDVPSFIQALHVLASSLDNWIWVVPGLLVGLIFGALPGVSVSMALALTLPLSLHMEFLAAIIFLTSVYTGAAFGGSVPAILLNIPGTPGSLATTFDGYAMSKKGQHNEALGYALFASTIGGICGYLVLIPLVEPMANAVLKLGALEMLVIALWGMLLLGSLGATKTSRGIIAGAFGVLIGTVGMNTAGFTRGTLGLPSLLDGVSEIPAMIGLLAAGQLLDLAKQDYVAEAAEARVISLRRIVAGCAGVIKYPAVVLRGSIIGILVGAAPGVGSSIANLLAYAETKRTSKDADTFGKGNPKGIVAAESAVASGEGGSMATMLALGIPGSGATAVLLAAFGMHNIVAGPSFVSNHRDMVYAILLSNICQCILLLGVGVAFLYVAVRIVKVRTRHMLPMIFGVAVVGAIAVDNSASGPITLAIFAVVGYILKKYDYPAAAVVVGLLLGRLIETEALRSWQLGNGNFVEFVSNRPIAMGIFAVLVLSVGLAAWSKRRRI